MSDRRLCFILSVDTEEEWDWSGPFPSETFAVENARYLPAFHQFCQTIGIRPTYFVDYAILDDRDSLETLRTLGRPGQDLEIGAHLHPWCNPPSVEVCDEEHSHVVNLPLGLVRRQVVNLTERLVRELGIRPTAFRTGRWGTNADILNLLEELGYLVDSSVYPYYRNQWFSCEDNDARPYWPRPDNALRPGTRRPLVELPVSAGFNRLPFETANRWHQRLSAWPIHHSRAIGILWRLGWLRKIYLSPELATAEDMTALVDRMLARGERVFHMYLHSSSLMPGAGEYVTSSHEEFRLYDRIGRVIRHLKKSVDVEFCTITEAANRFTLERIERESSNAVSGAPKTG